MKAKCSDRLSILNENNIDIEDQPHEDIDPGDDNREESRGKEQGKSNTKRKKK